MNSPAGSARPSAAACPAHIGEKSPEPCASALARSGASAPAASGNSGATSDDRADLAHHAIDDAARRPAGQQVGERGAVVARGLERGAVRRRNLRFRAPEIGRADLHAGGAERERCRDAARVGDGAGGDDRHLHGIDDLRHQRESAGLRGDVVGQEHAAMAAGLVALRDDRVDAALFEPARFGDGRGGADDHATCGLDPLAASAAPATRNGSSRLPA